MQAITVYCASSDRIAPCYFEAARALGAEIARRGAAAVTGAGKMGLMAAVTNGALEAGGEAIGVIPRFMAEAGRAHPRLTRTIVTDGMADRKKHLQQLSCGLIALPGGVGTLEELSEALSWKGLGLYSGPVVILNINGYYDSLIAWLEHADSQGFNTSGRGWLVAQTPKQAVDLILGPED